MSVDDASRIIIDDARLVLKIVASLFGSQSMTLDNRNIFIVPATAFMQGHIIENLFSSNFQF